MYKDFYHLSTDPFRLTPDPSFCFSNQGFSKARAYLQQALTQGDGIPMVVGRPGIGKTTLAEDFLAGLDSRQVVSASVVTTHQHMDDLSRMVAYAFGLNAEGLDQATLLNQLEQFFIRERQAGRRALLIVDEAQNLSVSALEGLRLLTNLHLGPHALLQLFLLGHEQLLELVCEPHMEQFHQRLIACSRMVSLSLSDTQEYVVHRLGQAGWRGNPQFSRELFVLIHRFSQGIPRYINTVCGRLLLHGAMEQKRELEVMDLAVVIKQMQTEFLVPPGTGNNFEIGSSPAGLQEILSSGDMMPDWESLLSEEERVFIRQTAPITWASSSAPDLIVPEPAVELPVSDDTAICMRNPVELSVEVMSEATGPTDAVQAERLGDAEPAPKVTASRKRQLLKYGLAASIVLIVVQVFIMPGHAPPDLTTRAARLETGIPPAETTADIPALSSERPGKGDPKEAAVAVLVSRVPQEVEALEGSAGTPGGQRSDLAENEPVTTGLDLPEGALALSSASMGDDRPAADKQALSGVEGLDDGVSIKVDRSELQSGSGSPGTAVMAMEAYQTPAADALQQISFSAFSEKETSVDAWPSTPGSDGAQNPTGDSLDHRGGGAIQDLFLLAEQAVKEDRLTIPEGRSAVGYYRQILQQEQGNPAAERGLQEIVRRYGNLAETAIEHRDYKVAQRYIVRGLKIGAGDAHLLALEKKANLMVLLDRERRQAMPKMEEGDTQLQDSIALEVVSTDRSRAPDTTDTFLSDLKAFFSSTTIQDDPMDTFSAGD